MQIETPEALYEPYEEPYEEPPASTIPLVVAADVQDHLIAACNDLQRLFRAFGMKVQ